MFLNLRYISVILISLIQKGSIENGSRLIRERLPKKAKIDLFSQKRIEEIIDEVNNRPMKTLGFLTPKEAFLQESLLKSII
tara:strand:- start:556 stop:798 length:243 start_codon:yes stop_codon:yes gene_type:complete